MSNNDRKSRDQLKDEYKQHYRKMRAAKERYRRIRNTRNIADALRDMNSTDLMESFDSFLFELQSKVTRAEARLDVALESIDQDQTSNKTDQGEPQASTKETLQQVKQDMGLLYNELEQQAQQIDVNKTVGTDEENSQPQKDKTKQP